MIKSRSLRSGTNNESRGPWRGLFPSLTRMIGKVQPVSLIMLLICSEAGVIAVRGQADVSGRHEKLNSVEGVKNTVDDADVIQHNYFNPNHNTAQQVLTARVAAPKDCADRIELARKNLALYSSTRISSARPAFPGTQDLPA